MELQEQRCAKKIAVACSWKERKKWKKGGRHFEFEAWSDSMGIVENGAESQVGPDQQGVEN